MVDEISKYPQHIFKHILLNCSLNDCWFLTWLPCQLDSEGVLPGLIYLLSVSRYLAWLQQEF